jgi:hypothetical protein
VHLGLSLWGKDKVTEEESVIWCDWIEERQTEGLSSKPVRYSSYCGADQIGKNVLDRKSIAHGGQIVHELLTIRFQKIETT